MAAGLGFKTFTTGEVLTASDVNGYLMQGILVFASEAARNSAITSPQEGQFAFTKDNNSLWYYTGSAWVASGAAGDIEGVTAGVGISGGGTSGTVTITNDMATTITASGDIVVGTGSGTYDNLPIGTTGQILTADTTVSPYKVKWAAPASSGGMTLISTTSVGTGTTVTLSNIFATSYKQLYLLGYNIYANGDNRTLSFAPLNSSDVVCDFYGVDLFYEGTSAGTASADAFSTGSNRIFTKLPSSTSQPATSLSFTMLLSATDLNSRFIPFEWNSITNYGNQIGHNIIGKLTQGSSNTEINKLRFTCNGGNFAGGTLYLYGVN